MKRRLKIDYNAPVILTFALISLLVLVADTASGGMMTRKFFSVYHAPLSDPLTYVRMFCHVFGHANYGHYISNITLMLVIGPSMEEKYGSGRLFIAIAITALVSGLAQFFFFPNTALLGASGIVFMLIMLSSLSGMRQGAIPLSLILVGIIYLGGELVDAFIQRDNISQLTHIIGGICGSIFGFAMRRK